MKIQHYGWRKDRLDPRDRKYLVEKPVPLPPILDLRLQCPAVYDQGQLGSCTANAIAGLLEFDRLKQGLTDWTPSRLFIYYNERVMEGTADQDAGAEIRDGIKSVAAQGAPPETEWPYDISKFTDKPSDQAYQDAMLNQALQYYSIDQNLTLLKTSLVQGFPFAFGFVVYQSFESDQVAQDGMVPMPKHWFDTPVGGHAVEAVGYNDQLHRIIGRNSWGPDWGDHGYFYMPYEYITNKNLASDFWNIKLVEKGT